MALAVAADALAILEYAFGEFPVHPGDRPFQAVDRHRQLVLFGRICEVGAVVAVNVVVVVLGLPRLDDHDLPVDAAAPAVVERRQDHLQEDFLSSADCAVDCLGGVLLPLLLAVLLFVGPSRGEHAVPVVWLEQAEIKAGRGHWLFLLSWPQSGWDIWRRGDTSLLAMIVARWMILSSPSRMCAGTPPAHGGMLATCFSSGQ